MWSRPLRIAKTKNIIFVLSSPSGGGKTTLTSEIVSRVPGIRRSVSYTTRPPRNSEIDGVDYHFVSEEEFRKMIRQNEFLEWVEMYGHLYGTAKKEIEKSRYSGTDLILTIDTEGAQNVKKLFPDAVTIFIAPPSIETLKERIAKRREDDPEEAEKRLQHAVLELKKMGQYDYIVVNDYLEEAVKELEAIITAARRKSHRVLPFIEKMLKMREIKETENAKGK